MEKKKHKRLIVAQHIFYIHCLVWMAVIDKAEKSWKKRILALVFVVRLALIHRQPVSSQHGFGDDAEPCFLPD